MAVVNAFYIILCAFWTFFGTQPLRPQDSGGYEVKAVFLLNFAHFVIWPREAFPNAKAPFVIGVLGESPFDSYLHEVVEGERVNKHPIRVALYNDVKQIKSCQILFINLPKNEETNNVLRALKSRNILTVSDTPGFASMGGMIQLSTEKKKLKIRINQRAVFQTDVTINSKLLRLAEIVN